MSLFDDEYYGGGSRGFSGGGRRSSRRRGRSGGYRRSGAGTGTIVLSALLASLLTALLLGGAFAVFVLPKLGGTSSSAGLGSTSALASGDPYDRLIQAAASVRPSVVSVVNHRTAGDTTLQGAALGSGVIFKKDGGKAYVITNNHVVAGAKELETVLIDGTSLKAKLVGSDTITDVAVLEIDSAKVGVVAQIGDSDKLRLGETVIALGNPLGLGDTLTSGIVSYPKRVMPVSLNEDGVYDWEQQVIQTDAAINEGNSGGALVDLDGRLIGINTMKIADTGVEGIGFAIPVNQVMATAGELLTSGKISRPYLGVYSLDLNNPYSPMDEDQVDSLKLPGSVTKGVVVLESLGPAKDAGIELNDVIVGFDGQSIDSTLMLRKYLYGKKQIGDKMTISYYRDGKKQSVSVTLGERPEQGEE
ncbi:trypsin-like peptidase domain-containing protein [Saccharibacillus sp. CPCC 101409]|uniref:S1C family serine protease n=1 Tax=Saccharibacillus sp. CPCC 101409 TaxID=3058041 RepID=UPI002671010C|nr:trypsin-like peptidase domain-containing protein [Saccharibacillus sp. CPCC 101409]MDO3409689.1 trypsin-like peptidase domain-containing protein [Saccharibacillus sp. CPCC 101409]